MDNILIRNIEEKEIPKTVDITIESWQITYRGIIDSDFLDSMNRDEIIKRRQKDYIESGYIVAVEKDEIVGFCRYIDSNKNTPELEDVDCEIIAIYVKPDKKHNGIGKRMFQYVLNEFKQKNKTKMIIWCLKDNLPSRRFYEAMGGIVKGEHNIKFGGKEYQEVGYEYLIDCTKEEEL